MNVTSKISVDMTRQNVGQRVNAVQGDGSTRLVEITLLSCGAPWTPPEGVEAAIAYMQPGGTKGLYNKLADGTAAISISGNVATINLAPQMLTASGTVQASLVFNDQQLNRLTTFPFAVSVTSNPAAGAQKTEDYIRLQWLEDKLEEYWAPARVQIGAAVQGAELATAAANQSAQAADRAASVANAARDEANLAAQEARTQAGAAAGAAKDASDAAVAAREAEQNANDAAGRAGEVADTVQQKLDNGEFIGPRGDALFAALEVDDDGHLHLLGAENTGGVTFALNEETGNLEVNYG